MTYACRMASVECDDVIHVPKQQRSHVIRAFTLVRGYSTLLYSTRLMDRMREDDPYLRSYNLVLSLTAP